MKNIETKYIERYSIHGNADIIGSRLSQTSVIIKRCFEILFACLALIISSPIMLLCFLAIRCEDGKPSIFKQERIGKHGRPFYIYKFRSMRKDAEKDGPMLAKLHGDKRLTKVGRFLRNHHLDELPQLWNVFIGNMSFVGPRPERKYYIDKIMKRDPRYRLILQVKPGLTSFATLYNGYTDNMDKMLRRLRMDLFYIQKRSLLTDASIIIKTIFKILFGKIF